MQCMLLAGCLPRVLWPFAGVSCPGAEVLPGDYSRTAEYLLDGGIRFDPRVAVAGGYDAGWRFAGDGDVSGYENFVSQLDISENKEKLNWLGKMDATSLKNKVAASIVAISSIHLLRVFMDAKMSRITN